MENELLKSVTLSVVQRAFAQLAAGLVVGGWITEDQSKSLLLIIAGVVGSVLVYGYTYFKNKAAQKLSEKQIQVALRSDSSKPVETVKTEAAAAIANP